MNLDDRIRDASPAYDPGAPPLGELSANVERRRRKKLAAAGGGVAVAVALLIGAAVALPNDPSPTDSLTAADQPNGANPTATEDGAGASTTAPSPSTSMPSPSADSTIAPSGTAYSPPATVGAPPKTTVPAPGPTTTAPPPSGDTITVTAEDNGKTFTLRRGHHLVVSLSDSGWIWSEPDTDNAKVLKRTAVSANPSSDHVTASFDAIAGGQAHVTASKDAPCRQSEPPCMVPTYMWQVTINVI